MSDYFLKFIKFSPATVLTIKEAFLHYLSFGRMSVNWLLLFCSWCAALVRIHWHEQVLIKVIVFQTESSLVLGVYPLHLVVIWVVDPELVDWFLSDIMTRKHYRFYRLKHLIHSRVEFIVKLVYFIYLVCEGLLCNWHHYRLIYRLRAIIRQFIFSLYRVLQPNIEIGFLFAQNLAWLGWI